MVHKKEKLIILWNSEKIFREKTISGFPEFVIKNKANFALFLRKLQFFKFVQIFVSLKYFSP